MKSKLDRRPRSAAHRPGSRREADSCRTADRVHCQPDFSLREARRLVGDLFEPNPLIYWSDFLGSAAVAGAATLVLWNVPLPLAAWYVLFAVSVLAVYRAALFIHELTHLRAGRLKGFAVAWNVACGIPFFIPSFLYGTHSLHHVRKHYATADDGEYLPLANGAARNILLYVGQSFVVPALALVRFMILTPLAWISPTVRRWVQVHASSMVIDPSFVRPLPTRDEMRVWRLQEAGCFCYLVVWLGIILAGFVSWTIVLHAYALAVCVMLLNSIRTLGAHRYAHGGEGVTFVEQMLDSCNYPAWPLLTELWAPVGLRFHALHHLFPSLPYHALGTAHKRLMAGLPADSPYRRTECPGLYVSLRRLWRCARSSAHGALK